MINILIIYRINSSKTLPTPHKITPQDFHQNPKPIHHYFMSYVYDRSMFILNNSYVCKINWIKQETRWYLNLYRLNGTRNKNHTLWKPWVDRMEVKDKKIDCFLDGLGFLEFLWSVPNKKKLRTEFFLSVVMWVELGPGQRDYMG